MCRLSNVRLTLYPNHKVGQVIIVFDFLGGYNKPLLENLEEVGWLKESKEPDQAMSKVDNFAKLRNSESFPHV